MDRGTAVHAATAMMDRGEIIEPESIDPRVAPYLPGWSKFNAEMKPEFLAIEEEVENPTYAYQGRLDRIAKMNGRTAILDIKTGWPEPWHALQLAGYAFCFPSSPARFGVYLSAEGKYKLIEYTKRTDYDVFKACLIVANFKKENP